MRNYLLFIYLCSACIVSCQKIDNDYVQHSGNAIRFGASTGYENSKATRTEYSGLDENGISIASTSRYERIDWVAGTDRIRILCEAAGNGPIVDYAIDGAPTVSGQKSLAGIVPIGENDLKWGAGDHYFYSMYPAPGMESNYAFTDNNPVVESKARLESASGNKATISGVIPAVQEAFLPEGGHEFKANMNYAYMYAATKVENGYRGEVTLAFMPLVTTIEFTFLTPADDAITGKLTSVTLKSASTSLSGSFSATISEEGLETISTQDTGDEVTVTLPDGGVQLSSDTEYKVTLLTLPVDQTDLTLTLNFEGGVKRTLALTDNGKYITVPARKKVYIRNLNVPGRIETESMDIVVSSNSSLGRTIRIPFEINSTLPTTIVIDWGDGSEPETFDGGTAIIAESLTHTYADSDDGNHTITITSKFPANYDGARIPNFSFYNYSNSSAPMLKGMPTPILNTTSEKLSYAFKDCTNLESICSDLFMKNPECTDFSETFQGCSNLSAIPAGLFDNNMEVTTFYHTFYNCKSLQSIPTGLFDNNTKVKSFSDTFYGCSSLTAIPAGLFDNNPKVTNFQQTFYGCNSLTSIPAGLFDKNTEVTTFLYTFRDCRSLVGPIPTGLFDNNTKVKSFSGTFQGCQSLVGPIPTGLFDNNTMVTSFGSTFFDCSSLNGSIPEGLFDNNTEVTSFSNTFMNCISLSGSIPAGLFDHNTKVTSFLGTFNNCNSLVGPIPAGLFDNNPEVTTFAQTFNLCKNLSGSIPAGLFDNNTKVTNFNSTFNNCNCLVGPIPTGLFDNNTKATQFSGTFSNCYGLTSIPAGLFDNNTEVTNFSGVFSKCSSVTSIPAGLFDNNTKVTNFNGAFTTCLGLTSIPAGLFDNNTEVTDFSLVFSECSSLNVPIPGGLFAHNLKVTTFKNAFNKCISLPVISDVFIKVGVSDPTNRFTSVAKVDFSNCFLETGTSLASRGTAPDLWNYTLPGSVTSSRCFGKLNTQSAVFTNQADIPATWR